MQGQQIRIKDICIYFLHHTVFCLLVWLLKTGALPREYISLVQSQEERSNFTITVSKSNFITTNNTLILKNSLFCLYSQVNIYLKFICGILPGDSQ